MLISLFLLHICVFFRCSFLCIYSFRPSKCALQFVPSTVPGTDGPTSRMVAKKHELEAPACKTETKTKSKSKSKSKTRRSSTRWLELSSGFLLTLTPDQRVHAKHPNIGTWWPFGTDFVWPVESQKLRMCGSAENTYRCCFTCIHSQLVGGNSNMFYFHPENWGRFPF